MIKKPRGTRDHFGENYRKYREMIDALIHLFKSYNFEPFSTPIFESQNLFVNSVGETSDIVTKEMYLFSDRSNRPLVLRPEGTAPLVRAVIENKLYDQPQLPLKFFYFGPMFRYERPQVGRSRQFDQVGIEVFGPNNLYQDLEIMRLIKDLIMLFGLESNVILEINYLVSDTNRNHYINALKENCAKMDNLCDLCHLRLEKNPLRILDCKEDQSKFIDFPKMLDYLTEAEKEYWKHFQSGLNEIGLNWKINHHLVRGLDYYTGLIFELKTTNHLLKSQNTFLAGGRYNNLVNNLGGPKLDAIGFAIGTDRLFELLKLENNSFFAKKSIDFYIWAKDSKNWEVIDKLIKGLHHKDFALSTDFVSPDTKRAYRKAEQLQAKNILLVYDYEKIIWKKNGDYPAKEYSTDNFLKLVTKGNN